MVDNRRRPHAPLPPVPTLGELLRTTPWVRIHCEGMGCHHATPVRLAGFIARYGAEASSDILRRRARCSKCGHRGASLRLPSFNGSNELTPFPGDVP